MNPEKKRERVWEELGEGINMIKIYSQRIHKGIIKMKKEEVLGWYLF